MVKEKSIIKSKTKKHSEVLNYIKLNGPTSRVDIAAKLNMTKATVTGVSNELILKGVLCEKGEGISADQKSKRGRKKIYLDINENYKLVFCIAIEKSEFIISLTNLKGEALDKTVILIKEKSYREILETIVEKISGIMKLNCINFERILAISVTLSESALSLMELGTLKERLDKIQKDLTYGFKTKVLASSTIKSASLAQKLFGENQKIKNAVILRYGAEKEASFLIDGKIYQSDNINHNGVKSLISLINSNPWGEENSNDKEELLLAKIISTFQKTMGINSIFYFGDYFSQEEKIEKIKEKIKILGITDLILKPSVLKEDKLYLSGCAAAIEKIFFNN